MLALLALIPIAFALPTSIFCVSAAKLNVTMHECLLNGEDAVFTQSGICTIVICAQGSAVIPKVCATPSEINKSVEGCLANNTLANVYGNANCSSVRCMKKAGPVASNQSNNSSIIDTAMAIGNKYGSALGTVGGVLATAAAAIIGWHYTRKKKTKLGQYLNQIDGTYSNFKMNAQQCEAELLTIKRLITEDLKKGTIDESTFGILDKRMDDYLGEIRQELKKAKRGK